MTCSKANLSGGRLADAISYNLRRPYSRSLWKAIQGKVGARADGKPGPETAKAVARWQAAKSQGLAVDGMVGPDTLEALRIRPSQEDDTIQATESLDLAHLAESYKDQWTFGIDVSKWQPDINWGDVRESGAAFVVIKASQYLWTDSLLADHLPAAINAQDAYVGVYHLAHVVHNRRAVDPVAQADHFVDTVRAHVSSLDLIDLPFVLDLETDKIEEGVEELGVEGTAEWIRTFCAHLQARTNRTVLIYISRRGLKRLKGFWRTATAGHPLWVADYVASHPGPPDYKWDEDRWGSLDEGPDRTWALRQFTSEGRVRAVGDDDKDVDLNCFPGPLADFEAWLAIQTPEDP